MSFLCVIVIIGMWQICVKLDVIIDKLNTLNQLYTITDEVKIIKRKI